MYSGKRTVRRLKHGLNNEKFRHISKGFNNFNIYKLYYTYTKPGAGVVALDIQRLILVSFNKYTKSWTFDPHQSQKRASPLLTRKQFEHVIRASSSLGSGGADILDDGCWKYNFAKIAFQWEPPTCFVGGKDKANLFRFSNRAAKEEEVYSYS